MATLSRLELSEEEKESYTTEINNIFSFIEELNKLDTSSVDITVHAIPICNIFREDVVGETLELGKALQNAPDEKMDNIVSREFFKYYAQSVLENANGQFPVSTD